MKGVSDAQLLQELRSNIRQARKRGILHKTHKEFYQPVPEVQVYIDKVDKHLKAGKSFTSAFGYLFEQLAYAVFRSLHGTSKVTCFQSAAAQYDNYVTGNTMQWSLICEMLRIDPSRRGMLVEVKGRGKPCGDKDAQRLASAMHTHLQRSVALGVLFSIKGVTGDERTTGRPLRQLSNARLTMVLASARMGRPLVSLDWESIKKLGKPGTLLTFLENAIEETELLTGIKPTPEPTKIPLPKHLKAAIKQGR